MLRLLLFVDAFISIAQGRQTKSFELLSRILFGRFKVSSAVTKASATAAATAVAAAAAVDAAAAATTFDNSAAATGVSWRVWNTH